MNHKRVSMQIKAVSSQINKWKNWRMEWMNEWVYKLILKWIDDNEHYTTSQPCRQGSPTCSKLSLLSGLYFN